MVGFEYRQTGKLLPTFKVNIADITGFSVRRGTRQGKRNGASALQQVFVLQGGGTELAACPINNGIAQKMEEWVRRHPVFRGNVPQNAPVAAPGAVARIDIADQLSKLAQLRNDGLLSQEEFDRARAKLLG